MELNPIAAIPMAENKIPYGPQKVARIILSLTKPYPDYLNGTLAFENPCQLRKRIHGETRPQDMNKVALQISSLKADFPFEGRGP